MELNSPTTRYRKKLKPFILKFMNSLANTGMLGNPPVSTDVKPARVTREAVVLRTTKNYQEAVVKIQWNGVY